MLLDSASQHRTGCSAHASYDESAIGKQRVFGDLCGLQLDDHKLFVTVCHG
jgi:hypothetical protein